MTSSIQKNYIYNLMYQVLLLIVPLITAPYLARVLGVENIGRYSYIQANVGYFLLIATLGTTIFGQRELAYVRDDQEKKSKLFFEIVLFRACTSIFSIIIFLIVTFQDKSNFFLYLIFTMDILAVCIDISWFFLAIEKVKLIVIKNTIAKCLSLIFLFIFIKSKENFILYIFMQSFLLVLSNFFLWIDIKKEISFVNINKLHIFKNCKGIFRIFLPQIAVQIYLLIDKTMIGLMTSSYKENGYYDQSQKIIKIGLALTTALSGIIMPRIAYLYNKNETEQVRKYIKEAIIYTQFLALPIVFGLIGIAPNFIIWFFGANYEMVILLIQFLSPICLFIGLNTIIGNYLLVTKNENVYSISVIVGVFSNILLNYYLIPNYKALGAVIASVVSEFIVMIVQIIYLRRFIRIGFYIKSSVSYLISASLMLMVMLYLEKDMNSSICNTLVLISVALFVYLSSLYILKDKILFDIVNKLKKGRK